MDTERRLSPEGIWRGVYPVLCYEMIQFIVSAAYAAALLVPGLCRGIPWAELERPFLQKYMEGTVTVVLLAALVSFPLFGWMYRRDTQRRRRLVWREMPSEWQLLWVVIGSGALALFGNNLMSLTPLPQMSDRYQETTEALYTGGIWLRMACAGFFAPAIEELLMRGICYQRFRDMMRARSAMFWSALAFGLIHGNIVQGLYAFLVGLYFAWLTEKYQRIVVPMLAHISANLFVVLLQYSEDVAGVLFGTSASFLLTTLCSGGVFFISFLLLKKEGSIREEA